MIGLIIGVIITGGIGVGFAAGLFALIAAGMKYNR